MEELGWSLDKKVIKKYKATIRVYVSNESALKKLLNFNQTPKGSLYCLETFGLEDYHNLDDSPKPICGISKAIFRNMVTFHVVLEEHLTDVSESIILRMKDGFIGEICNPYSYKIEIQELSEI